jgi:hypothetical protein
MKILSTKCVPNKRLLMLQVRQTALYFNYNLQNCKRSIQISNTVREKYRFVQSTYSQNTQNLGNGVNISSCCHTHCYVLSACYINGSSIYWHTGYQLQIRTRSLKPYRRFGIMTSARSGPCRNIDGLYSYISSFCSTLCPQTST